MRLLQHLITAPLRFIWRKKRLLLLGILSLILLSGVTVAGMRAYTAVRAQSLTYTLETVPARPVAIIFGAHVYTTGPSDMLADRIEMARNCTKRARSRRCC